MRLLPALAFAVLAAPAFADDTAFTLDITFEPAGAARLAEIGEKVVVSVLYFGEPAEGNTMPLDDMGQVVLIEETVTIEPVDQKVVLGAALSDAPADAVTRVRFNINFLPAGQGTAQVTLWCGIIDAFVDQANGKTAPVTCQVMGV